MFQNLQNKLRDAIHKLKGHDVITEANVSETLREVRRALLDADVSYAVARDFTRDVKAQAIGQKVLTALNPGQLMVKVVRNALADLMGSTQVGIHMDGNPSAILIAGLQGSGKTSFSVKLAHYLKSKKGKKPLLVAGDVHRPAAVAQLQVWGAQIGVPVFALEGSADPVAIARQGIQRAQSAGCNPVIVDTAGRLAVDAEMMDEVSHIHRAIRPSETLFVVDSMTGQDAVHTATAFNDRLDFDGVVLTKLDGDARGGAALTIKSVVHKPIKFISTGERMDAIDVFYPKRMADRILGMGDVVSLVERAQAQYDAGEARKLQKRIAENRFDFNDFLKQIERVKRMGSTKDLLGMLPGAGRALRRADIGDDAFKQVEAIIFSMTPYERENPSEINSSRRRRIAKGSGTSIQAVNRLLKQFAQMAEAMKLIRRGAGGRIISFMSKSSGIT